MAQLDRLLSQIITKAGRRLELKADRKPRLELKSGETIDLLPNSLPAVMVDVLAGDVVPPLMARVGDVGMVTIDGRDSLAVCNGETWVGVGLLVLVAVPLDAATRAWRF